MKKIHMNVRLNELRMALNETQTEFGKRFGASASCISLWEQGKRQMAGPAQVLLTEFERVYADKLEHWNKSRRKALAG